MSFKFCHVFIVLCDVGGGPPLPWYENRGTGRCFSFPITLPVTEGPPPPSQLAGALADTVSDDRDPQL